MIEQIQAARREKIINKTREKERELRGEVLPRTLRRARKSVPSFMLHKLSSEQMKLDRIARSSISEVGYVGYAKKMRGWKLKEDPWKKEDGPEDVQARLNATEKEIMKENERRRKEWDKNYKT
jgi:transposase